MKRKEPTHTSQVIDALRAADDFLSYRMLERATGAANNQVSAACHHLRKRRAIDCIVEPDGVAWWFLLPPEEDTRTRTLLERTPETKPRRSRKVGRSKPRADG